MPTSACDPRQGRVGALADHLGIGRFAVLAHWLGSAFALACGPALADRPAVICETRGEEHVRGELLAGLAQVTFIRARRLFGAAPGRLKTAWRRAGR